MQDKQAILYPEGTYHIYNRANGSEQMFLSEDNYGYFLSKYNGYISRVSNTLCYCLMPNHFHFLVRIKGEKDIIDEILKKGGASAKTLQGFRTLEGFDRQKIISSFLSLQFSHLFNSYTQAFNKQIGRKGSLFMHPFKRKLIQDEKYLRKLIHYIHYNPIEAGLTKSLEGWKYSSYNAIVSRSETRLQREEVLGYFDNLENFIYCHKSPPNVSGME
ncbi:transposase [Belliella kenyensis]|uniref:Transposase n=1 Tax=Belliella kenyensis TaxID=1472724 RepID=A0ABV8EJJ6_9BACT|nr:hypothetical protein [Belliella kenyensis]MCH7400295.1 hypothetical protein [Belliella kenyensis]MDN3604687.1 hypothetical protein [Belliella kenyensis]MDN3605275.1 hypothetical protein [Belliella kenyensis]